MVLGLVGDVKPSGYGLVLGLVGDVKPSEYKQDGKREAISLMREDQKRRKADLDDPTYDMVQAWVGHFVTSITPP